MFKDASLTRERDLSREGTNYQILKGCCQHAAASLEGGQDVWKRQSSRDTPFLNGVWCQIRDLFILTGARKFDFFFFNFSDKNKIVCKFHYIFFLFFNWSLCEYIWKKNLISILK